MECHTTDHAHQGNHRDARALRVFADSVDGMEANAVLYSLVQTCIANRVDPYKYLKAVIERMPYVKSQTDLEKLLPWALKQEFNTEAAPVKLAA